MKKTVASILCVLLFMFTATGNTWSSDRFVDNSNGTVTDTRTGLIWLKDAYIANLENPYHTHWYGDVAYCNSLASGQAGLTDGSTAGQWRLPTKEELEGIGTDPPATWFEGSPPVPWTKPGLPFTNVHDEPYWSGTSNDYGIDVAWSVNPSSGFVGCPNKSTGDALFWPVRGEPVTITTTTIPASGGEIIRITNNNVEDFPLAINSQGHVLFRSSPNRTQYYYNGYSITKIGTSSDLYNSSLPVVERNLTVYSKRLIDGNSSSEEIFIFDGVNETQITHNDYPDNSPAICNGFIVWIGFPDLIPPNPELYRPYMEIFLYKPDQPTAVNMSALKATPANKAVKLNWQTETEMDTAGFNVWRAEGFKKVNQAMIPAEGSPIMGADYDFFDRWVMNGKLYYYLLEDIDNNGISTFHGPVKAVPRQYYKLFK